MLSRIPALQPLRTALRGLSEVFAVIAAAGAAANAVENHRHPDPADLRRLGLDGVRLNLGV